VRIGIYAFDSITLFHLSAPQMVFDEVRRQGLGDWETFVFTDRPGGVRTAEGYEIGHLAGLDEAANADVIVVPSWHTDARSMNDDIRTTLSRAHTRGTVLIGLCLGAIPLVDAGVLDGRAVVTHWQAFDLLRERHPGIELDQSVLYIDHGDVLTSAGTAAGLDACLHFVRSRLGAAAANTVARSLVIAPHREGGQAQYIERPVAARPENGGIAAAMEWALGNLSETLSVERLAEVARMSRRTFVRTFQESTATTPAAWVRERRLDEARRLLEETTWPVERVGELAGFASSVTLRQNFTAAYRVTPSQYRQHFRAVTRAPERAH
jgi:transcriptional regulator GlxA family with amidase domain